MDKGIQILQSKHAFVLYVKDAPGTSLRWRRYKYLRNGYKQQGAHHSVYQQVRLSNINIIDGCD